MKRSILLIALALSMTGCSAIKDAVMDKISPPEDIVIDYVNTIIEMYSEADDCGKLAKDLATYCERREEPVSKAIKEVAQKIQDGKFNAKERNELSDKVKEIKSVRNLQCIINPRVLTEMALCAKPLANLSFSN